MKSGFSTRQFSGRNISLFLKTLELAKDDLVLMEQVHGKKIKVVDEKDKKRIILGVDGLVTQAPGVVLGVKTADCLPILFYEPQAKLIGVAHVGWKGVLARLPQKMIDLMLKMGAFPAQIQVKIGPHIGACCYNIQQDRAQLFLKEFGQVDKMIQYQKGKIFLDLLIPVQAQLINSGILPAHLESSLKCTSCLDKEFFSYRRDSQVTYGGMLAVISL